MSGDGGSKKKSSSSSKADESVPAYLGGGVPTKFAQGLPGQIPALAQQLSMGYGAPVSQNLAALEALYSPMSMYPQPAKPEVGKPSTPQPSTPKPPVVLPENKGPRTLPGHRR